MKLKRLMSILLSMIMAVGLLAGCGGNTVSVTEPASQESVKVQGPAMWLDRDNVFEIYERTAESGVFHQNYWTNLPYESHSKSMLSYYIETHLLGEAGLTLLRQDETKIESQMLSILFFTHPEAEVIPGTDYCLMLAFCEADGGGTEIQIDYSDSLTLEEWDATVQAESEQESEPKSAQSKDPAVLPDFLKTGTDYEVSSSTTSHMKVYTEDNMDISAVETYLQQLQDMGYAIVYTETDDFKGINQRWELAHSGLDAETISENGAHVIVQSNTYTSWNDQTLSIEFSDGITMDGGDSSVPSSTGGGYVDCPSCSGGSCTACNGSKGEYSYSPGLEREWEECWKCNGTGKCSKCDGFGKIFG